jgi:hypothetical protein
MIETSSHFRHRTPIPHRCLSSALCVVLEVVLFITEHIFHTWQHLLCGSYQSLPEQLTISESRTKKFGLSWVPSDLLHRVERRAFPKESRTEHGRYRSERFTTRQKDCLKRVSLLLTDFPSEGLGRACCTRCCCALLFPCTLAYLAATPQILDGTTPPISSS